MRTIPVVQLSPGALIFGMKLSQNQVYKQGDEYLRIVVLERLQVSYKAVKNLLTGEGKHHQVSKKEFCRLIKGARLLTQEEVREIWMERPPIAAQATQATPAADDEPKLEPDAQARVANPEP